jgi:hypothetical protein
MQATTNRNAIRPTQMSRYTMTEIYRAGAAAALRIEGKDRNTVTVVHKPTHFVVEYKWDEGWGVPLGVGLFDFYGLSREVAVGLMFLWEGKEDRHCPRRLKWWATQRVARALGKRLHSWYKGRLAETDSAILAVQRAVFAATFSAPEPLFDEKLYRHEHLVKDLIQHRAAAVALANVQLLETLRVEILAEELKHAADPDAPPERADYDAALATLGVSFPVDFYRTLEMMRDWRGLFSPWDVPYRSLDRTLMNLPGGVPHSLIPFLKAVPLRQPILSRLELATLALYEQLRLRRGLPRRNEAVFLAAAPDRIARAAQLVGEHTRNTLSTRRTGDLRFLVGFLMDYPEDHNGNIVGLAEKSIRWHRQEAQREAERISRRLGGQRETARPPVPLPDEPEFEFLSTVDEICAEGERMRNCVGSYAEMAVQGRCYLFHVSRAGEEATVEVDRGGRVVQAAGPRNTRNKAARWAMRVLNRWGRAFPGGCDHAPSNDERTLDVSEGYQDPLF